MAYTAIISSKEIGNLTQEKQSKFWTNLAGLMGAKFEGGTTLGEGHFKFTNRAAFDQAKRQYTNGLYNLTFITRAERRAAIERFARDAKPRNDAVAEVRMARLKAWAAQHGIDGEFVVSGPYGSITNDMPEQEVKAKLIAAGFRLSTTADSYAYEGEFFNTGVMVFAGQTRMGLVFTA